MSKGEHLANISTICYNLNMSVDTLLSPVNRSAFDQHRDGIINAAQELDITPDTGIVIGTGGLALHGLDGHYRSDVEHFRYNGFDADFVVSTGKFLEVMRSQPRAHVSNSSLTVEAGPGRVSVTLMTDKLPKDIARGLGVERFANLSLEKVIIDSVATLPAHRLAEAKLNAARLKDAGSIAQSHALADRTGHKIVRDARWLGQVSRAVDMLARGAYKQEGRRSKTTIAPWLADLVRSNFDDPAFQLIRPPARHQR